MIDLPLTVLPAVDVAFEPARQPHPVAGHEALRALARLDTKARDIDVDDAGLLAPRTVAARDRDPHRANLLTDAGEGNSGSLTSMPINATEFTASAPQRRYGFAGMGASSFVPGRGRSRVARPLDNYAATVALLRPSIQSKMALDRPGCGGFRT